MQAPQAHHNGSLQTHCMRHTQLWLQQGNISSRLPAHTPACVQLQTMTAQHSTAQDGQLANPMSCAVPTQAHTGPTGQLLEHVPFKALCKQLQLGAHVLAMYHTIRTHNALAQAMIHAQNTYTHQSASQHLVVTHHGASQHTLHPKPQTACSRLSTCMIMYTECSASQYVLLSGSQACYSAQDSGC
jgi:hypothetical protein